MPGRPRGARLSPAGRGLACCLMITGTAMLPGDPEELRQRVPVGRLGRPAEVAGLAAAILASPYLTSQVVSIDGGMYPR